MDERDEQRLFGGAGPTGENAKVYQRPEHLDPRQPGECGPGPRVRLHGHPEPPAIRYQEPVDFGGAEKRTSPARAIDVLVATRAETFDAVEVHRAASEVAHAHPVRTDSQAVRLEFLTNNLAAFLESIVANTRPGPERSQAIARAREALFWAAAAVSMEGR